jgi:hypothetical protein
VSDLLEEDPAADTILLHFEACEHHRNAGAMRRCLQPDRRRKAWLEQRVV